MSKKDNLFSLVKSMSTVEKAHFKKFLTVDSSSKTKNKLFKLFDLYNKEVEYDKSSFNFKILRLGYKNSSQAKYQLYRLLLQNLVSCNKNQISEYAIFQRILEAKVLQTRGMIDESLKELDAAEQLNTKAGFTEIFPTILIRKNYYSPYDPDYTAYKTKALDLADKKLEVLTDVVLYENISASNIPFVIDIGSVCKTDEERAHIVSVLNNSALKEHEPKSNFGKMMKQHLICFYSYLINDVKNAYEAACKAISLVNEQIETSDQGTLQNLSIFHYNAIQYALSTQNKEIYDRHFQEIDKIRKHLSSNHYIKRIEGELLFLELNWHLEIKNYKKALIFADKLMKLEDDLFKYNQSVLSEIQMKIALTFFYNSDYNRTIEHINSLLQKENFHTLLEEKTLFSLLEILCHIKIENIELAESLTRSLYRKLKKQNRLFQFEELIVRFLKELYNTPQNKTQRNKLGNKYLKEIRALKVQKVENFFLDMIDLETWVSEGLSLSK